MRFQSSSYSAFRQLLARQPAEAVTIEGTLTCPEEKRDRTPAIVMMAYDAFARTRAIEESLAFLLKAL